MQMSPPASPRVSGGGHHLMSSGSLGPGHRSAARRQLVAVHESVTALEVRQRGLRLLFVCRNAIRCMG
jgi:hypothetical protein